MNRPLALVVDENSETRARIRTVLADKGVETLAAVTDADGIELLRTHPVRLLLTAWIPSSPERRDFLERAKRLRPSIVTIVLADRLSGAEESEALRGGAFVVLLLPLDAAGLALAVDRSLAQYELLEERRSLREQVQLRLEDVPLLARHFVDEIRSINDLPPIQIAPETIEVLTRHAWPGNLRELRHAMEQAVILAQDGTIRPRDLPQTVRAAAEAASNDETAAARFRDAKRVVVEAFEKRYLEDLLARHRGNVTAAANQAGMLRSALQRLLRKYELHSSDYRGRRSEQMLG
jgi:DNA-binding NtrC family response regulator